MNTNASPRKIALLSAFLVGLVPTILGFFLLEKVWHTFLLSILTFLIGYYIIYYLLERFIYRKIKIIYKSIRASNKAYAERTEANDPMTNVSKDVSEWAKERKQEETFRREFVGNVSHELKTPIFQIQGYIHTLLEGALSDPKVNYKFLDRAAKSADRLVELVDDLTSINRIESGELEMDFTKFQLKNLVEEVFDEVDFMCKETGIQCLFKQSADVEFKVKADRIKIKQVLVNLVVNAIKYGEPNGKVWCGFYDMDKTVLVEISDNGEGIPKESLSHVFERFYRVEKSRTRDAGGSGLGLSIVKHIVEAHGHTINVKSELGKGTTFGFSLTKAK